MKKKIITILIIALIGTFAFAATEETARFKISATVAEGLGNAGVRVLAGNHTYTGASGSTPYNNYFDPLFSGSGNDAVVDTGDSVTTGNVEGVFSVLVSRTGAPAGTQITVNISATPMKNENGSASYLPYKITDVKTSNNVVNTLGNESSSTAGVSYIAKTPSGTSGVRDIRIFEYLIPKATNVEYGKYSATVFFTISTT